MSVEMRSEFVSLKCSGMYMRLLSPNLDIERPAFGALYSNAGGHFAHCAFHS